MKPKLPWRLPIAWRLGATAMIGLAGTLVVLISVILGARELRSARDDAVASLQAQTLIGRGRAELAEARERSLRFALAPSTEGVDAVKELIRACEEDFQAIRKMRRFDTLNEKLGLLLDGLSQYLGKFQKVVGLRERIGFIDTQGERDALAQSQRGARREIDRASYDPSPEVAAGKMPVRLLQIESAAKDFLLSKNLKSMIDFRNQEADLLSFIQKAPIESEVRDRLAAAVSSYNDAFKQLAQSEGDLKVALDSLDETALALAPVYLDLVNQLGAQADQANSRFEQRSRDIALWTLIVIAVTALVCTLLSFAVGRAVGKPIAAMTDLMRRLAAGELQISLPSKRRRDEIGDMAQALEIFKHNAIERAGLADEINQQRARQEEERKTQMRQIAGQLESSVANVANGISSAADLITTTASRLDQLASAGHNRCTTAAAAADRTSGNVQAVASAATELTASIAEVGRLAEVSLSAARQMVVESDGANSLIGTLSDAAAKVSSVVDLVRSIASQTHLLALNATIEAARAGPAGKGFSIVAHEVKVLAQQTSEATEDIGGLVKGMIDATQSATRAVEAVHSTIAEVRHVAAEIASAVGEQSTATLEIARIVSDAAAATSAVAHDIGEAAQMTERTGGASGELVSAAAVLSSESVALRREVEHFLCTIRSD